MSEKKKLQKDQLEKVDGGIVQDIPCSGATNPISGDLEPDGAGIGGGHPTK